MSLVLLTAIAFTIGCGVQKAPELVPSKSIVVAGDSQQFMVNQPAQSVTWSVNGIVGGNAAFGTISATGLYTAPPAATATPITITASSMQDIGSLTATVNLTNPMPVIATVNPAIITASPAPVSLDVKGSGFTPQSVITIDGTSLTTTYVNGSELRASATLPSRTSTAIGVTTPTPGGGSFQPLQLPILSPGNAAALVTTSVQFDIAPLPGGTIWSVNGIVGGSADNGQISTSGLYVAPAIPTAANVMVTASSASLPALATNAQISIRNPMPVLAAINPPIVTASSASQPLTATGSGFTPQSTVVADGATLPTTFVSSKELRASLDPSVTAAKTAIPISVVTAQPGGGVASSLQLPILSPGAATVLVSDSLQFTVADLPGGTVWSVNGKPGGAADTGLISPSGIYNAPAVPPNTGVIITASSSTNPAFAANATLSVQNPVPVIGGLDQGPQIVSSWPVAVTVSGNNFTSQSVVTVAGIPQATTFVSGTQLKTTITQQSLQGRATADIGVMAPAPGGGNSSTIPLILIPTGNVQATTHPLVARYNMTLPTDANMTVEFGPDQQYGRSTWTRPNAQDGSDSMLVAGMNASRDYHMRARIDLPSGQVLYDSDHLFTSGPLPQVNFPNITISHPDIGPSGGGVEMLSPFGGGTDINLVAADGDGSIIWYCPESFPYPVRQLPNGNFLINSASTASIEEVDLECHIVRQLAYTDVNAALTNAGYSFQADSIHHDVLELPNGHWVFLVQEHKDYQDVAGFPGTSTVISDAVLDFDQNNHLAWVWRAFDHLDVNRHPFMFPDWTHSNGLAYTADGNLLISMRHQSWVLKLNYANGSGDGSVLWKLGFQGDFVLAGGAPSDWFYDQHFPNILDTTGTSFRLALFDNGDQRPDNTGQPCDPNSTCYSRGLVLDVDESNRIASIVWQYPLGWYSFWGGSIVRLANGNFDIDSATVNGGHPRVVEVTQDATPLVVWELDTDKPLYRSFRIPSLYPGVQW